MSETIVKLNQIGKTYKKHAALKNCNLELKKGKIYGLIGKNGAGKTTMMRIIAGLSAPTSGTAAVNAGNTEKELHEASALHGEEQERKKCRIGSLIEAPALNGGMTAAENLKYYRLLYGETKYQEKELLSLVGLEDTARKKVKDFSLGMRQRLGIAVAMLGSPEIILLDEPINGLDPIGVIEIRNLIGRMCSEFEMTVLISSHNLPELYQTATDYIIIDRGEIKKQITFTELEQESKESLEAYFLSVIGGK